MAGEEINRVNDCDSKREEASKIKTEETQHEQERETEEGKLRQELEEWQTKADELLDKYRRGAAEFANYRKRQEREREQQRLRLSMDVLRRLLPIVDDLDRALRNVPDALLEMSWVDGITLISHKAHTLLGDFDVAPIEALGEPFNPNYHSALMQEENDEYAEGTVLEEIEKGYMIADQVLRPTLVKISRKPQREE